MKALCWHGTNDIRCDSVPDPKIEDVRDVIIKVTACAICGSDLHLMDGMMPTMKSGDVLGHEFMGEVVEVGQGFTKFKKGDKIVVPFNINCGECRQFSGSAPAQTAAPDNAEPTAMDKVKSTVESVTGSPMASLDPDMRHVIDALGSLDPKPLPKLTAVEARQQPGAADAAMQVLRDAGKSTLPDPSVMAKNILVDGAAGKIVATVYVPEGAAGPLPVIVYFHGGGFVIANNSTYDASARMLAKQVGAVVISPEYSKAPEHKFPASHDDAIAAYAWITKNAASLGGDPKKIAVAGESAGGNLAVNVAIAARNQHLTMPVHELVVYPMAGTNLDTASYKAADSSGVKPLNKPMMAWFYANLTNGPADMHDPRLDIVGKADLHGLAPATVITDTIDPLQSEGEALAAKLKQAGVQVDAHNYDGVTHEFFGMGLVVGKAKEAEDAAVKNLKAAFGRDS